ncbi:hypothetical protein D3C87_1710960 [compost metagenome]
MHDRVLGLDGRVRKERRLIMRLDFILRIRIFDSEVSLLFKIYTFLFGSFISGSKIAGSIHRFGIITIIPIDFQRSFTLQCCPPVGSNHRHSIRCPVRHGALGFDHLQNTFHLFCLCIIDRGDLAVNHR